MTQKVYMNKGKSSVGSLVILLLVLLAGIPCVQADEGTDEMNPNVVKKYRGLQFKVPEDWPIEKVGNTIGPIPIEEYMGRKFNDLNLRLKKQEDAMAAMEKRLEAVERRKRLNG